MKRKMSIAEIILKCFFIGLFFWVIIVAMIKGNWSNVLGVLIGAAGWEYILFFLHRFDMLDVTKYWNGEDEEESEN